MLKIEFDLKFAEAKAKHVQKTEIQRIDEPLFEWRPSSPRQEQILYWWTSTSPYKRLVYAAFEGSIRAIKTSNTSYSFINCAIPNYDQEKFALTAETIND